MNIEELQLLENFCEKDPNILKICNELLDEVVKLIDFKRKVIEEMWLCCDCQISCKQLHEIAYMLHDKLWYSTMNEYHMKVCCIDCFEKRLGRQLNWYDFDWSIPLNSFKYPRSDRLNNRMGYDNPILRRRINARANRTRKSRFVGSRKCSTRNGKHIT